jgi:hypothetical protein
VGHKAGPCTATFNDLLCFAQLLVIAIKPKAKESYQECQVVILKPIQRYGNENADFFQNLHYKSLQKP